MLAREIAAFEELSKTAVSKKIISSRYAFCVKEECQESVFRSLQRIAIGLSLLPEAPASLKGRAEFISSQLRMTLAGPASKEAKSDFDNRVATLIVFFANMKNALHMESYLFGLFYPLFYSKYELLQKMREMQTFNRLC